MYTYSEIFKSKQNILIVTAHPDDAAVFFCGLISQLRKDGKNVFVVVVTNGARGSRKSKISEKELSNLRITEELESLKIMGVPPTNFVCLDYKDGEVESNLDFIGKIVKYLRKWEIEIVCSHDPAHQYEQLSDKKGFLVQHRDHRKTGEAVIDAVYPFARDRSFFPEHSTAGYEPVSLFDIVLAKHVGGNFKVDFTKGVDLKKTALIAHKTQLDAAKADKILTSFSEKGKHIERFEYLKLLW